MLQQLIDHTRQQMIDEFEQWYADRFVGRPTQGSLRDLRSDSQGMPTEMQQLEELDPDHPITTRLGVKLMLHNIEKLFGSSH